MAVARPRREEEQDASTVVGRERMSLVGIEADERARLGLDRLATGRDPDAPFEHRHPRVLLHLVVAHPLARVEHEQHRASFVPRVDDEWVACAVRCRDVHQVPALHGRVA